MGRAPRDGGRGPAPPPACPPPSTPPAPSAAPSPGPPGPPSPCLSPRPAGAHPGSREARVTPAAGSCALEAPPPASHLSLPRSLAAPRSPSPGPWTSGLAGRPHLHSSVPASSSSGGDRRAPAARRSPMTPRCLLGKGRAGHLPRSLCSDPAGGLRACAHPGPELRPHPCGPRAPRLCKAGGCGGHPRTDTRTARRVLGAWLSAGVQGQARQAEPG